MRRQKRKVKVKSSGQECPLHMVRLEQQVPLLRRHWRSGFGRNNAALKRRSSTVAQTVDLFP